LNVTSKISLSATPQSCSEAQDFFFMLLLWI
jgi:hypothetical protein